MASEKEETFVCPRGLKNIVIPITEEDETVAYVVGCHVYSGETEYQKYMLDIPKLAQQRNLDAAFVAKTCSMLKTTGGRQDRSAPPAVHLYCPEHFPYADLWYAARAGAVH